MRYKSIPRTNLKQLFLIRHGEVDVRLYKNHYIGQRTNPSLSPKGLNAIKHYSTLQCDLIISSPLQRAIETAGVIPGPLETDARIAEVDFGDWDNLTFDEIRTRAPTEQITLWNEHPEQMEFPNGEKTIDFFARIDNFFNELKTRNFKNCAVVTHGGVITRFRSQLESPKVHWNSKLQIERGKMKIFILNDGAWKNV